MGTASPISDHPARAWSAQRRWIVSGFSQSRLAARLQDVVSRRREEAGLYGEIAEKLPPLDRGRLLDVGTGSGLQLRVIHALRPHVELYGLDLSAEAIRVARANLANLAVDLRQGSIERTPYDDGFFDVVTCANSMSYWQDPLACFDEIHRILKPGGAAVLFEPQKEIDLDQVMATIDANLAGKSGLRRVAARGLNYFGLRWGRTVGLKLYAAEELRALARRSRFGADHSVDKTTLQNLPIFVQITLRKPGDRAGPDEAVTTAE
jgi:SAM-dependent methyltransferase